MCPNPPKRGRRVRSHKKRFPYYYPAVAQAVVDRVTWPFRLADHDPTCRWAAFARRLAP